MITLKIFDYQTTEYQMASLNPKLSDCTIGRSPTCDLVLDSFDVSRVHAKIQMQNAEYYLIDPGSVNGCRINGQTIKSNQAYPLKIDDLIRIGNFVLLIEAINPTAQVSKLENRKYQLTAISQHRWTEEISVRCVRIVTETAEVKSFTFMADPPVKFNYLPGQSVMLHLEINGEPILRSYSISSTPSRPHTLEITVKRLAAGELQPAGLVSNWLHDQIELGSQIKISAPIGKFTCAPRPPAKLLLLSAGSGITPMMSMARWIADTAAATDVVFFHCARSPQEIIFRQELELLSARLPNFHLAVSITQPLYGQAWASFTGRLSESMLRCIAPDFLERKAYVCGPESFMQASQSLLAQLGFPMQNYAQERFGTALQQPPADNPAPVQKNSQSHLSQSTLLFSSSGQQTEHDGSKSVLQLAEQAGVKIRSNCRQGVCGACKKRKTEGEVRYDAEPDALEPSDRDAGHILTCVAFPVGKVVIEA